VNHQDKYLGQRSFRSKVIFGDIHIPDRGSGSTWATKVATVLVSLYAFQSLLNTLFDVMRQRLNVHALLVHELQSDI